MLVLVTGGAGFIGGHVVEALLAHGHDVRVVDALLPVAHAEPPELPDGIEWIAGDLRDPAVARAAAAGVNAVSHQAAMVGLGRDARDMPAYVAHNDLATAELLRALAERRFSGSFVLASSMVVYGEGAYRCPEHGPVRPPARDPAELARGAFDPGCPHCAAPLSPAPVGEDARLDPRSLYAATKLHQEHLAAVYAREQPGVRAVALRYHNVYGPRMPRDTPYAGVASIFRSALERGEAPRVMEDGAQRRDFVHVTDVAAANVLALAAAPPPEGFAALNVCSGEPHTIGDLAGALAAAMGGPAPVVVGGARPGDVRHVVADPARARDRLGFTAAVGFAEGVARFATDPLRVTAAAAVTHGDVIDR
jgi:dTDP-L-rhamnose 4-epimerase